MPLYEHVYLARQDASAQQVEELTAQLKGVVEGLGGSIKKTDIGASSLFLIACARTARRISH